MSEIQDTIRPEDVEWEMHWGDKYPDKPPTEMMFEDGPALAHLLLNEVVFLNSLWWEKECPERIQKQISVAVNCNDVFAWACADAERLPYEQIETLYRMWKHEPRWGAAKWCAIQRNQQPQAPVIKAMKAAGAWDAAMDALGSNTLDAEVHAMFNRLKATASTTNSEHE